MYLKNIIKKKIPLLYFTVSVIRSHNFEISISYTNQNESKHTHMNLNKIQHWANFLRFNDIFANNINYYILDELNIRS